MKKFLFTACLVVVLCSFQTAFGHEIKDDRDISVILHTNPDDDPIVGQPAAVLFSVSDKNNKFDNSQCDCRVIISEHGTELLSTALYRVTDSSTIYAYTMPFTFPKKDVYTIAMIGNPKTANAFQSFRVEYDLRVDRGSMPGPSSKLIWVLGGIVIIIAVIFVFYVKARK